MLLIDVEHIPYENGFDRKNGDEHFIHGVETMQEWIRSQPIVDAVKVVRCRDCIYRTGIPGQPNIICYQMHDDDFCSYGTKNTEMFVHGVQDSETIAHLLDKFKYCPEQKDTILDKYNSLAEE